MKRKASIGDSDLPFYHFTEEGQEEEKKDQQDDGEQACPREKDQA